jgi:hypothetical protein
MTRIAVVPGLPHHVTPRGPLDEEHLMKKAMERSTIQVNFPNLEALKAYPFRREQSVPNVPQIYLMYSPLDRAGRVGSCGGNTQFKRHAKPSVATTGGIWGPSWGWFEDMHLSTPPDGRKGMADSLHRLESSNFCWDAHRSGADRFVYYVLELVPHLNVAERRCLEQAYMDALRDQTDLEDYTGQSACTCSLHAVPRRYLRRKTRPRAATWR